MDKYQKTKKCTAKNWNNSNWTDTLYFLGSRAFSIIHPPDQFNLPSMIIGIFQNIESSSFGPENMLKIFVKEDERRDTPYRLVAHVQDSSVSLTHREKLLKGMPGGKNIILVNENQLQVRVKGNTLFAAWSLPIPLIPSKYILPPSSILFEGYGEVKSKVFNFTFPSGRKEECWVNDLDAFVTYFHPSSKYECSGVEGFFDRESIQISYPPNKEPAL